jgi:DNA-binding response OmpR family regulator
MTDMTKKILIAEDEKPLANALALKLQHAGFQATIATDGQACLELLAQEEFDVLLLDLMMPAKDGFQVLDSVQQMSGHKPVVFVLSNLGQTEDEKRAIAMGAKQYFVKADTPLTTVIEAIIKLP